MTTCFSLFPRYIFVAFFVLIPVILLAVGAGAQQPDASPKERKYSTVTYRVTVQTPDGCCDIKSEETTEGVPDKVTHYSFYRRFEGYFVVEGPHIYSELTPPPKLDTKSGADIRRNPDFGDQLKSKTGEIWVWDYSPLNHPDSAFLAKIRDITVTDSKSDTCGAIVTSHTESKSTFDGDVRLHYSPRDRSGTAVGGTYARLEAADGYYIVELDISPISGGNYSGPLSLNPGFHQTEGRMDMVDYHYESKTTSSDDKDARPDPPKDTKRSFSEYFNVHSKTLDGDRIRIVGDELQTKFCRNELPTKFDIGDSEIKKDIEKNKTLSVMVEVAVTAAQKPFVFGDKSLCY